MGKKQLTVFLGVLDTPGTDQRINNVGCDRICCVENEANISEKSDIYYL